MCALDIPDGTKIEKVLRGGKTAPQVIMRLLDEKSIDGHVRVSLTRGQENITSYMIVKGSKPRLGLREVVTRDAKDPRKKVRKLYAGENTLHDVIKDSSDKDAKIEVHSGVDVEAIIKRYAKEKKPEAKAPRKEVAKAPSKVDITKKDARKVGLFWGGKETEEAVEREVYQEKMNHWKREGYDVSNLNRLISGDLTVLKAAIEKFEEDVATLEDMAAELELLSLAGFEIEVNKLKTKLKNPQLIPDIRAAIKALENKASKRGERAVGNICLVCGYPLNDETRCPRCGAILVRKEVKPGRPEGLKLRNGHCYLIEEEKLRRSLGLFMDVLNKGYSGFCITRTNPKHLRTIKEFEKATILWLTDKESATEQTIPPVLERIMYEINDFLRKEEKSGLILDGTEYLISSNSFDAVLRFLRRLVDEVSESKSILLVTVGPYTLKEQELKILEKEMEKISFDDT